MASTYGNTKLNICNECDERPVEMMVGKAMCAWANARETFKIPHTDPRFDAVSQDEIVAMLNAEYEATIRCIAMFVTNSLDEIQAYVTGRAKAEFGI